MSKKPNPIFLVPTKPPTFREHPKREGLPARVHAAAFLAFVGVALLAMYPLLRAGYAGSNPPAGSIPGPASSSPVGTPPTPSASATSSSASTTPPDGALATIQAGVAILLPTPTNTPPVPKPTVTPYPTCPALGTLDGDCFEPVPTPTIQLTAPVLPTPTPLSWCGETESGRCADFIPPTAAPPPSIPTSTP